MKKNEDLQIEVQDDLKGEASFDVKEIGFTFGLGKNLKKLMYATSLVGIALFFYACMGGYVAVEPIYQESVQPPAPSNSHIWISGDWNWNRQSHTYVQREGYWSKPNPSKIYVSGHWQKSARGNSWVRGHWQRQNR